MTRGAEGSAIVNADGVEAVPAFEVDVVDTTGCGDAFVAGFIRGLSLGRSDRDAAVVGAATASLVATGLGTDAGEFDLDRVLEFAGTARELPLPG
jgi:sugar/nucleoside kinase (ribokinase family)